MTNKALRDVLKEMPAYAVTVNEDIDLIHKRFIETYAQLKARGEEVDDNKGILFDTYAMVPDKEFRGYMHTKKGDNYENVNDMQGTDFNDIIKKVIAKFQLLKQTATHQWGAPSNKETQIIALRAEVKKFKDNELKLSCQLQSIIDPAAANQTQSSEGDTSSTPPAGGGSSRKQMKNRKNRSDKKRQTEDEAWKKVPPKAGEPKVKQHGNKTWNWCKHHQAWCIHLEENCEKGKQLQQQQQTVANQATIEQQKPAEAATGINPSFAQMLAHLATIGELGVRPVWLLAIAEAPNILTLLHCFVMFLLPAPVDLL
jgi:hypothetical protein